MDMQSHPALHTAYILLWTATPLHVHNDLFLRNF